MTETETELRVRPYVLTGGRAESEVELALDTVVASTELGRSAVAGLLLEEQTMVELAADGLTVTELAGRVGVAVQVALVLAGDLVDQGLLDIAASSPLEEDRPDVGLLERVLDGLHSL